MRKSKLKVAVIGVGNMGRHHARNYYEMRESNLVAICDIDPGKAELAKQYKCAFYTDFRVMLKKEKVDALSIAVPTKHHYALAMYCIKNKKHVLVEKPIATTVPDARRMIALAAKMKVTFTVGHIERFNPGVQKMQELINQGKLGDIISIISKRVGPFAPRIKDSGVLIDLAVHDIDIIGHLLNKLPTHVTVNGGKAINKKIDDFAEIFLRYGNQSGYIQVNWITPVIIRELHVTGTKGYAHLNYITQELGFYKSRYKEQFNNYGDFVIQFGKSHRLNVPFRAHEPLRIELQSFLKNITLHTQPVVSGQDGLEALRIALRALHTITYA